MIEKLTLEQIINKMDQVGSSRIGETNLIAVDTNVLQAAMLHLNAYRRFSSAIRVMCDLPSKETPIFGESLMRESV